jgi:apolipoprotein N-acyltransferase
MALALPPFDFAQLGWLALVPLLFAIEDCRPGEAFRRGYIAGLVFFSMTVWWTVHVTLPGMVALIAFLALYFGAAAALFRIVAASLLAARRDTASRLAATNNLLVAGLCSAGWVTLEWVRGQFLMGGFPWNFLGVTQHRAVPVIQFASLTGVYGVSALVCVVNFALYFTVRRFICQIRDRGYKRRLSWEFYIAMLLLGAAFFHGIRTLRHREPTRSLPVALVQGNIPQTLKFEPAQKLMILERYRSLTELAVAGRPDLIIWPETATPEPLRYDPATFALVTGIVAKAGAYLLTGTMDETLREDGGADSFNAAILAQPDASLQAVYRKTHLVPFGEYVPWRKVLPVMKWLTPIADSFERGREFTVFDVYGFRFGTVICFEDTVPGLFRRYVRRDVDFMVNLTNDAWFKTSPAAELHLANAKFRAIENRRPLVRATNNGVTCIVDEFGFVRVRLEPFAEGATNCTLDVPETRQATCYTKHGDVFVAGCALLAAVGIWLAAFRRNRLELPA